MDEGNNTPAKKKTLKRIPIYVVEEHNDALNYIYSAIGAKKLPVENNTMLHLDAHPDMLINRELKGEEARSGRKLIPLLQIENWIVPAAAAGHIGRVVWLRPPWSKQFQDGTSSIRVGDHPKTGLLRVDSKEPYYLSDALYSSKLCNDKVFKFTVAELGRTDTQHIEDLAKSISIEQPYILDIDLDFFSTDNPFLKLYPRLRLYDRLEEIFDFNLPSDNSDESIEECVKSRAQQLDELERIFGYLDAHNELENYEGPKSELFHKVHELAKLLWEKVDKKTNPINWYEIHAAGCTRDQGGLPYHISSDSEIYTAVTGTLRHLLLNLPPPTIITIARSSDDDYCPANQVEYIQTLVLDTLKEVFETEVPKMHYLEDY